jgi:hypothetical protein
VNDFERAVADGQRRLEVEQLRQLKPGQRPFMESWWMLALWSLQAWPRVLLAVAEPTHDRVGEALFFSGLFAVFLVFWLRARRKAAARRAQLAVELAQSGDGTGNRSS